ncbi:hypothetical protein BGZ76_002146, partial [Entomortierella beljakovae]
SDDFDTPFLRATVASFEGSPATPRKSFAHSLFHVTYIKAGILRTNTFNQNSQLRTNYESSIEKTYQDLEGALRAKLVFLEVNAQEEPKADDELCINFGDLACFDESHEPFDDPEIEDGQEADQNSTDSAGQAESEIRDGYGSNLLDHQKMVIGMNISDNI